MRLDDRAADREPHPHSMFLRRKERFEYPLWMFYASAAITDFDLQSLSNMAQAHFEGFVVRNTVHRFHAVAHQVDQNLLNLNAIDVDRRKVTVDLNIHPDRSPLCLLCHKLAHVGDEAAGRRRDARLHGLLEHGTDPTDYCRRPIGVANDSLHGSVRTINVRWSGCEPA